MAGELVKHTKEEHPFYNLCDRGKVVYVYNQENILVEWTKCDKIDNSQVKTGFLDLHNKESLELRKK